MRTGINESIARLASDKDRYLSPTDAMLSSLSLRNYETSELSDANKQYLNRQ